ncbi:hypothetical protein B5M45_24455 [Mycobacterium simiae]|uniref:Glucose-methanol-choline oxidoreductase C-terminal domain-containing protein n=1 Tax=Mycobacterium simiae TaxID=1784 RepID=A0A1X0XRI2_MYCSI|nr:hypothetical protein B5M45_24455 [Mycobacterium simiae]
MSHPGSRAAADDPNAVVQRDLRVRGVAGLPDASTMPPITSGNTNAPTITIGERSRSTAATAHSVGADSQLISSFLNVKG